MAVNKGALDEPHQDTAATVEQATRLAQHAESEAAARQRTTAQRPVHDPESDEEPQAVGFTVSEKKVVVLSLILILLLSILCSITSCWALYGRNKNTDPIVPPKTPAPPVNSNVNVNVHNVYKTPW